MVLPVKLATPPFKVREIYGPMTAGGFTPVYYSKNQFPMYVQKPPFTKVLPTEIVVQEVLSGSHSDENGYISINDGENYDAGLFKYAYNKAYSDLQDSINSSQSQLAATIAEARRTAETINNRIYWLFNETARLQFKMRKKLLSWKKRKNQRYKYRRYVRVARRNRMSPEAAGVFIEYRWVYEATAKDIYNAVDHIQNWSPTTRVKGKAAARDERRKNDRQETGTSTVTSSLKVKETDLVRLMALCAIDNPNLFWAQQMGLTNPAGLAWELTKFSWLVDWFGTLGEVVNSWDDNLGLRFIEPCTLIRRETVTTKAYSQVFKNPGMKNVYVHSVVRRVWIDRTTSLGSGPFLLVRQIKGPSLVRGATAIALLLQLLRR